jgi:GNAT superfamily N-acetyltransferase
MPFTIRDARPDELDAISRVMLAAYEQYMPAANAVVTPEYRAAFARYRRDIGDVRARLATSDLIVAEDDGQILGAVTFYRPHATAEYPTPVAHEPWPREWATFRLLAVEPAQRGRGIGRALAQECIRRARALRAPALGLHSTAMMTAAVAMYRHLGWVRAPLYDHRPTPDVSAEGYVLWLSRGDRPA